MHTPGHMIINYAVLGAWPGHGCAILLGGLVPDLPIMVLYGIERLRGTPEETIWSVCYQHPAWLAVIHGAHSIPLAAGLALLSWVAGAPTLAAFFASVLLHALCDLPIHAIDAHRHFLPFSQYRFVSPLSYWDVRYHGRAVALAEAGLVLGSSVVAYRRGLSRPAVALLGAVNLWYAINYVRSFLLDRAGG